MTAPFCFDVVMFPVPRGEVLTEGTARGSEQAAGHAPVVSRACVLALMLLMTGLTFVKELALFQVIQSGLWMHLYHFARDYYYDCLSLSFAMAVAVTILPRACRRSRYPRTARPALLLAALWVVGGLNLILLTANNGINLLEGRPLHSSHQGIGW